MRYHNLVIKRMREVLERRAQASKKGPCAPVLTCRGHFKSYSTHAPLFAHYTGMWWWAEHRQRNAAVGEFKKDYRVKTRDFAAAHRRR